MRPLTVSTPLGSVSLWKLTVASSPVTVPSCRPVVLPIRKTWVPTVASSAWVIWTVWPLPTLTSLVVCVAGSSYFTSEKSLPGKVAWSTVAIGWPSCESDHCLAATPQCPAVRKAGVPSLAVTLKPSEQRTPPWSVWAKMASPPETSVLKEPAVFLTVAMFVPRLLTVDRTVSHLAPVTLLSARTWILLVLGSTDQAVPGTVALVFNTFAAAVSSAVLFCTLRTLAPAFSACTTTLLLSPEITLTTSCWVALS